jgi:large subunit ribosomal protein L10
MAITRKQKEAVINDLVKSFDEASSVTFIDYTGLTVAGFNDLRAQLRKTKARLIIAKNTLVRLALAKSKRKELKLDDITGQMALAFAGEDEIAPAKIIYEFAKKEKKPQILKGILEMELLPKEKVVELAKLPAKPQMLGILVGTIAAPVSGFVNVLTGNLRGLVNVINSIKDAKA